VADAVRGLDQNSCSRFFQEFTAAGGELTTVRQIT